MRTATNPAAPATSTKTTMSCQSGMLEFSLQAARRMVRVSAEEAG
jgi:hypothetical protein